MIIYYTLSYSGRSEDSHVLLRDAIAEYIGNREKAEVLVSELKKGKNGKPYIEGFDHFSISHSDRAWAVLFSEEECGLDIQYGKRCDFIAITKRWYAPEDRDRVLSSAKLDEEKGKEEFFRIWTRREALAKTLSSTVYDSELPAVCSSEMIKDIILPGDPELYAAVCIAGSKVSLEIKYEEIG